MSTDEPLQEPATYTPRTSISDSRNQEASTITIDFDGGHHVIVRPNRIIRGHRSFQSLQYHLGTVTLNSSERLYVTQIRIKSDLVLYQFRADEIASVQVEEGHGDNRGQHIYQMTTTFFDVDWKLWGNEPSAFSLAAWEELETGQYTFPFALKFPNVNFPPSLEEPSGFCVRYVWTAVVDGPALSSGLRSKEFVTPYRPIIVAPPEREWIFKATLTKEKKAIAEVQAKLSKQAYCPGKLLWGRNIEVVRYSRGREYWDNL
ncbi:hypothetical protein BC937DRAFT_89042 [Endogone sp. FLAS-F59071]|nr:hypothetical protein BC937DRAFT_89042 [Endogone sp. FLAS-F59071]|eukprot:RUS18198.1 hypothetical protein BC937DRAFT_89042 [Endogone sp. FLAS-F59071]